MHFIAKKILEWLKRYLPAELMSIIGAIAGGSIVHFLTENPVLTALGGTWGENVGYYGEFLYQEFKTRSAKDNISLRMFFAIARDMVLEFGFAEYLDSFLIRPTAMYFFTQSTGSVVYGLFLGKISADVTFYIPTIISYELKKKYALSVTQKTP